MTFLTTRTSTGSKVDVFHQSQPLTQSSDVTHAVRVVKNVTCMCPCMDMPRHFNFTASLTSASSMIYTIFSFAKLNSQTCKGPHRPDRTRFCNATRIFSFQKQIKPSTDKNFIRYADQIAKITKWSRIFEKQ